MGARDQVFLRVARPAPPRRPRRGIHIVQWARHLFPEHCPATLAPMSHLRSAGGIHQPSREQSQGSGPAERGQRETPGQATIGIRAPFRRSSLMASPASSCATPRSRSSSPTLASSGRSGPTASSPPPCRIQVAIRSSIEGDQGFGPLHASGTSCRENVSPRLARLTMPSNSCIIVW
jgi:hypothetical protein